MAIRLNKLRPKWVDLLLQPHTEMRLALDQERAGFNLLVIFLSGIVAVHTWADIFDLGDTYATGKIMSTALVGGPLIGFLLISIGAFVLMVTGCLLDPTHKHGFEFKEYPVWLPLKKLLWRRIFGRKRLEKAFDHPALRWYKQGISWIRSALLFVKRNISGGRAAYVQLFSLLSRSTWPLVLVAVIIWLEFVYYDAAQFLSDFGGNRAAFSTAVQVGFLVVKIAAAGWFAYLWQPILAQGFRLDATRSWLGTGIALMTTLGLLIVLLSVVLGIPIQ